MVCRNESHCFIMILFQNGFAIKKDINVHIGDFRAILYAYKGISRSFENIILFQKQSVPMKSCTTF